ncbi:hypothetical protein CsSME_00042416 [Camellia sinensis var. sinensis]
MVSKRLYEAVFGHSNKPGANEVVEHYKGSENFDTTSISSDGSAIEDKQALTFSSGKVKHMDQDIERDNAFRPEDGVIAEAWRLHSDSALGEGDANDNFGNSSPYPENPEITQILHGHPHTKENELTLKRLAKAVFDLQHTEGPLDLTDSTFLSQTENVDSFANSIKTMSSDEELNGNFENIDEESSCSSIPRDFICPLTGLLFEDPVTLETGQTFERAAITEWFNQGYRTCPVTEKTLEIQSVPHTNFILKRVIDSWKSVRCRHLLAFASQQEGEHRPKLEAERAAFILQHLLTSFSKEERITNAKLLMSLGGLQFLVRRFDSGNLTEKTTVAALFSSCIEADNGCRNYIARNIKKPCLLELIHSKQVKSRENAVLLLTELICLDRRKDVNFFLSGFQNEGMLDTMHQRPLVAVLLLHLDLLVEPRKYSIYREEAVDAITVALDGSLYNEKIRAKCCRALLILGGQEEREDWLRILSASLIGDGKKSFLESISKCLGSGSLDLVRVCLTTVAWLSSALASLSDAEFQLPAFSALISQLKERLENGDLVEHKILASMCLLNFSKIPECRVLLMTIAEELAVPLRSLAEVTWTAKELYATISGGDS